MSKVLNVKLLNSDGGYLESIPDHLMKRILAKLLFVHETYKNGDGSFGVSSLVEQVEFRGHSLHFVFVDDSEINLVEKGNTVDWVSSNESSHSNLSNNSKLLERLKTIVTSPSMWK
jgi:hypothetical protein